MSCLLYMRKFYVKRFNLAYLLKITQYFIYLVYLQTPSSLRVVKYNNNLNL